MRRKSPVRIVGGGGRREGVAVERKNAEKFLGAREMGLAPQPLSESRSTTAGEVVRSGGQGSANHLPSLLMTSPSAKSAIAHVFPSG